MGKTLKWFKNSQIGQNLVCFGLNHRNLLGNLTNLFYVMCPCRGKNLGI